MVLVAMSGEIYIWAKDYTENWSAFAPDFKELEENEEYVEREDEFDIIRDTKKVFICGIPFQPCHLDLCEYLLNDVTLFE